MSKRQALQRCSKPANNKREAYSGRDRPTAGTRRLQGKNRVSQCRSQDGDLLNSAQQADDYRRLFRVAVQNVRGADHGVSSGSKSTGDRHGKELPPCHHFDD